MTSQEFATQPERHRQGADDYESPSALQIGVALYDQPPELALVYDTAPIGLAFLTPDCRYLKINQRLTEICGISVADHIGRSVRDTLSIPSFSGVLSNKRIKRGRKSFRKESEPAD